MSKTELENNDGDILSLINNNNSFVQSDVSKVEA
jgi:hypothetical protein